MLSSARRAFGLTVTFFLLCGAALGCWIIWNHYLTAPWTRDGQVQGYVVDSAPEVSGRILKVNVRDNQAVRVGDVLYEIDPVDFQISVASAEANMALKAADMANKQAQNDRREQLTTLSTSSEEKQSYTATFEMARASYASAVTQLNQSKVNLQRTRVLSPVNGYVTNLQLRAGDYATTGQRNISVVDTDSFWVTGFFEETKLGGIHPGDPAAVALMGYRDTVRGHVESIARGINTPNTAPGSYGLASVDPVFTWVRLAQRIPVRIHVDQVPETVHLSLGLTATVSVGEDAGPSSAHGFLSRLFTQSGS